LSSRTIFDKVLTYLISYGKICLQIKLREIETMEQINVNGKMINKSAAPARLPYKVTIIHHPSILHDDSPVIVYFTCDIQVNKFMGGFDYLYVRTATLEYIPE